MKMVTLLQRGPDEQGETEKQVSDITRCHPGKRVRHIRQKELCKGEGNAARKSLRRAS